MVSASDDQTIRLWHQDGAPIATLSGHTGAVTEAVFSPAGKLIASSSADQTIRLWTHEGELLTTLSGYQNELHGIAFSPGRQQTRRRRCRWHRDGLGLASIFRDGEHC